MARDAGDGLLGQTLRGGDYELQEVIARGGQATVYRAYARRLDADVAVKVLDPSLASDPAFRDRFHDEARSLARLHHPNLVEVHWYGEEGELVYIVMRLVGGGTLKDRLRALGAPLGLTEAGRAIGQVAEALQHAHDRGVLHLDVKPANILLGRADWPLLTDLGLTRLMSRERTSSGHSRVAGTPAYMSPEQCRGAALDPRSDQYSLAVTAYELFTGRQPFRADTTEGLMQQHLEASPPRPRELNPGLPGPIEAVLLRGLAKDPAERYPSVREFGQALSAAVERTRGVALETKAAAAASIPNLLGILALVLATPLLLAMLPIGTIFGRLPLAWPFQVLLAGGVAGLLLGIRWHLIGLLGRAVASPAGLSGAHAWRRTALAACEGIVNLLYLLALFRLVGVPGLAVLRTLLEPFAFRVLDVGTPVLLGLAALAIVGGIARTAGALPAAIVLSVGWAAAAVLPAFDLNLSGEVAVLASTAQAVVAAGLVVLLLAHRHSATASLSTLLGNKLARVLVRARPGTSSEDAAAVRQELRQLTAGVLDFAYLLLAYALLREPVSSLLSEFTTPLAAAIVVTASAALVWVFLGARLYWTAGLVGGALGAVLGLPILVSLPVLEPDVVQATWPATVASWLAAGALLTLLAIVRGPTQAISRAALGAQLDRGLLGAHAAATEDQSTRRVGALGQVAGALVDVAFLLVVYWVVGVPATDALVHATGRPELSSLILAGVLALSLVLIAGPARRAAGVLAEADASHWRGRARAFTVLALASAAATVGLGGAAPTAIAGPSPLGPEGVSTSMLRVAPPTVIVDWDFWQPWTPAADQATYNLALRCSNGSPIGEFREVLTPPPNASMPVGTVGHLGATGTRCEDWQQVYQARRHAAGLTDAPSASWSWIDVQANVNPEGGVDVVQTQRALFSAGQHTQLAWDLGPADLPVSGLQVLDGDAQYVVDSPDQAGDRTARTRELAGERWVEWNFPPVASPTERTYVLRYHLAQTTPDQDPSTIFQHVVASANRQEPVWRTTVRVHLPEQLADIDLGLAARGAAAQAGRLDPRTVWFAASDLASQQALSVAVNRAQVAQAQPPAGAGDPVAPPPAAQVPDDLTPAFRAPVTSGSDLPAPVDTLVVAPSPPVVSASSRQVATPAPTPAPATAPAPAPAAAPVAVSPPPPPVTDMPAAEATPVSVAGDADSSDHAAGTPTGVPQATSTVASLTPSPTASPSPSSTAAPPTTPTASPTPISATAQTATPAPAATPDSPTATPTRATSHGGSGGQSPTATPTPVPDTTPPVLVVSVQPARAAADQTVLVTVTASESLAGLPTIVVSGPCLPTITPPVAAAASGGFGAAFSVPPGVDDCTATVTATAADLAGNASSASSATVSIDRTSPVLSLAATPDRLRPGDQLSIEVHAAEPLAGVPSLLARADCLPGSPLAVPLSPSPSQADTFRATLSIPGQVSGCDATLTVDATDVAGNHASRQTPFTIDATPPRLTTRVDPDAGRAGASIGISVRSDEDLSAPPTLRVSGACVPDSTLTTTLDSTTSPARFVAAYAIPAGSGDCQVQLQATGADLAGNASDPNTGGASIRVDRTRPRLSTSVRPGSAAAGTNVTIDVVSEAEPLATSPDIVVEGPCVATARLTATPAGQPRTYTATYSVPAGSSDCTLKVTATGTDLVGNGSIGGAATFDVDRTPPVLSVTADPNPALPNSLVTVSVDSPDEDLSNAPSIEVPAVNGCIAADLHVADVKPAGAGRRFSGTFRLPDGAGGCTATIVVSGVDRAGNTSVARQPLPITRVVRTFQLTVDVIGKGRVLDAGSNGGLLDCDQHCSYTFDEGTELTLHGVPAAGYALDEFTGCTPIFSSTSSPTCVVRMNQDVKVTAVFGGIELVSMQQLDAAGRPIRQAEAGSLVVYPITMRNTSIHDAPVTFFWEADQAVLDSFGWGLVRSTSSAGFDCGEPRQHAGMSVECRGMITAGAEAEVTLLMRAPTRNNADHAPHTIGWRHDAVSECCLLSLAVTIPAATPTASPTVSPSPSPMLSPTPEPSPSATPEPSPSPTLAPSPSPTPSPTASATPEPSPTATLEPTATPTPPPILFVATPAPSPGAPPPNGVIAPQATAGAPQLPSSGMPQPPASAAPTAVAQPAPSSVPEPAPTAAPQPAPTAASQPAPPTSPQQPAPGGPPQLVGSPGHP